MPLSGGWVDMSKSCETGSKCNDVSQELLKAAAGWRLEVFLMTCTIIANGAIYFGVEKDNNHVFLCITPAEPFKLSHTHFPLSPLLVKKLSPIRGAFHGLTPI